MRKHSALKLKNNLLITLNLGLVHDPGLVTREVTQIEVAAEAMIAIVLTEVTVTQAIVVIQTAIRTIAEVEAEATAEAVVILHVRKEQHLSNSH